jgi:hypothetical protein
VLDTPEAVQSFTRSQWAVDTDITGGVAWAGRGGKGQRVGRLARAAPATSFHCSPPRRLTQQQSYTGMCAAHPAKSSPRAAAAGAAGDALGAHLPATAANVSNMGLSDKTFTYSITRGAILDVSLTGEGLGSTHVCGMCTAVRVVCV